MTKTVEDGWRHFATYSTITISPSSSPAQHSSKATETSLTSGNIKPRFVYLQGSRELLEERAHARSGQEDHFMPATLLDSQLDTLEQPSSEALTISIELAPEQITETILAS